MQLSRIDVRFSVADQRGGAQFSDKSGKFCMLAPTSWGVGAPSYGESCIWPWFSPKRGRGVGWTPAYCLLFFPEKKRMKMNFGPEWERGVGIPDPPITLGLERGMARVEAQFLRLKFARVHLRAPKVHLSISKLGHKQCIFITRCGSRRARSPISGFEPPKIQHFSALFKFFLYFFFATLHLAYYFFNIFLFFIIQI